MKKEEKKIYPFSAIVGQEDFKLTLLLNLIDPLIGGVLAVGDKGTGKTTLIRSLTNLMAKSERFPFINLPIGASEDRLLGNIDLEKLINDKLEVIKPGLLAQANQGVLYVDEINLLQDYLTDVLLDAAASGGYYLEREGISHYFESRFCLVGSMNPEEGELRPQLKDRFGLSVKIETPQNVAIRSKIIQYRMAFDDDSILFTDQFVEAENKLVQQIVTGQAKLKDVKVTEEVIIKSAELAITYQVEGLRADILLIRVARAYAAYLGENEVTEKHMQKIAPFVLNHRSDLTPPQQQDSSEENREEQSNKEEEKEKDVENSVDDRFNPLVPKNEFIKLQNSKKENGNQLSPKQRSTEIKTDIKNTVGQYLATDKFELKTKNKKQTIAAHHVFMIDASGSMLNDQIVSYAKGAVQKIAEQSNGTLNSYSLISLFDGESSVELQEVTILAQVRDKLATLKTGGKTNIIAGLKQTKRITANPDTEHYLHIITDGRFNVGGDLKDSIIAFKTYCKGIYKTRVVDAEQGAVKIGRAAEFAEKIKAVYEPLMVDQTIKG